MSASTKCLQISLAAFNVLFLALGVAVIAAGTGYFDSVHNSNGTSYIIAGAVSIFTGLCGWYYR